MIVKPGETVRIGCTSCNTEFDVTLEPKAKDKPTEAHRISELVVTTCPFCGEDLERAASLETPATVAGGFPFPLTEESLMIDAKTTKRLIDEGKAVNLPLTKAEAWAVARALERALDGQPMEESERPQVGWAQKRLFKLLTDKIDG